MANLYSMALFIFKQWTHIVRNPIQLSRQMFAVLYAISIVTFT